LKLPPSAPPSNALAERPDIARMISLYFQCKNMGCLPEPGGLLDQPYDMTVYFTVFGNAEAEHYESLNKG
jgi:hypothetical protein